MATFKKYTVTVVLFVLSVLFSGCPAVVDPDKLDSEFASTLMSLSGDSRILDFKIRGDENRQFVYTHTASIENYDNDGENSSNEPDGGLISVAVPPGSYIDSIIPYIVTGKNGKYTPAGALDFNYSHMFNVTAEDNSERVYNVELNVEEPYGTEITGFMLKKSANSGSLYYDVYASVNSVPATGTVDITVPNDAVPPNTTITSFVPSFEITGSYAQAAGPSVVSGYDLLTFPLPGPFTVYQGTGPSKDYTVTVTVLQNTLNNMTSFSFSKTVNPVLGASYTGVIYGTDVVVSVPSGEDITSLIPTVSVSPEASVSPVSAMDFTGSDSVPVVYTVTAEDGTAKNYNVYVVLTGAAAGWVPLGGYGFSDSTADYLVMDVRPDDDRVVCAYQDSLYSNSVSALIYDGVSWSDLGNRGFTGGLATEFAMTIDSANNVYIANQLSTAGDIRVSEYISDPAWPSIGTISADVNASMTDMTSSTAGKYIIYRDVMNGNQVTVSEYTGGTLNPIATAGLTTSTGANSPSYKITSVGSTLYAAYYNNSSAFTVVEFTGSSWIDLMSSSFAGTDNNVLFDLIDMNGDLYCVTVASGNLIVRRYNGSTWNQIGDPVTDADISTSYGNFIKLAVNGADDVYLFYRDTSYNPNLVKINSAGTAVTAEGVLSGDLVNNDTVAFGNIAIDQSDKVYLAYRDDSHGQKITVLTYE